MPTWDYKVTPTGITILTDGVEKDQEHRSLPKQITCFLLNMAYEIMDKKDPDDIVKILKMISKVSDEMSCMVSNGLFDDIDNSLSPSASTPPNRESPWDEVEGAAEDMSLIFAQDYTSVLSFVCKVFIENEPLCKSVAMTEQDFKEGFGAIIKECCISGYSSMIKERGQLVGVCLAIPYDIYVGMSCPHIPSVDKVIEVLDRVAEPFAEHGVAEPIAQPITGDTMNTMYLFMIATDPSKAKQGFAKKVISLTHSVAQFCNYKLIVADATNVKSLNLLVNHCGFEVCKTAEYHGVDGARETLTRVIKQSIIA